MNQKKKVSQIMATRSEAKLTTQERRQRTFSESFKIQKVRELETGVTKISEICKAYQVSNQAVYYWLNKYGIMKHKKERLVIETDSDSKALLELRKRVAELEQLVGQKQIQLEFKEKMIELAEQVYGVDIKKKFSTQPSSTSGGTESNTHSV